MAVDLFYRTFDAAVIDAYGNRSPLANADIEFFNITQNVTIDTLTTDDDGIIAAGGFDSAVDAVDAGDIIELRSDGTKTTQFVLSASADEAVLDPNAVVTYVAEDLSATYEEPENIQVFLQDTAQPDKKPVYLGDAKSDGTRARFAYQSSVQQNVELVLNPSASTVKTEFRDPSTRVSTALTIPAIGGGARALYDRSADSALPSGGEHSLYADDILSNVMVTNGDKADVHYAGDTAANTNEKIIRFIIAGTNIVEATTTTSGVDWVIRARITRIDNETIRVSAWILIHGETVAVAYTELSPVGLDLAGAGLSSDLFAEGVAANDIVARMGSAFPIPAAPVIPQTYYILQSGNRWVLSGDPLTLNP